MKHTHFQLLNSISLNNKSEYKLLLHNYYITICFVLPFFLMSLLIISCSKQKKIEQSLKKKPTIEVKFGKPTKMVFLFYKKIYYRKPFPYAVLFYYSNGVYKIISPGEEHYGTYLMKGSDVKNYEIKYMSFPSSDWEGKVAYHELNFDSSTGIFHQQAFTDLDENIDPQWGLFWEKDNPFDHPAELKWSDQFISQLGFPKK